MAATKTTTKPAKKTATKKSTPTAKQTTKKSTAKAAPAKTAPVADRDLAAFAEQAVWAYAGVLNDAITLAVTAPGKVPTSRDALRQTRDDLTRTGATVVTRARSGVNSVLANLNTMLEAKATDGHTAADGLRADPRVERVTTTIRPVLDQAGNTRSQVKAAVTSITRTANAATGAATEQFGAATTQAKGVITTLGKVSGAAREAGRTQAGNARSQVKAARTSTRKTVDSVVEAGRKLAG